MQHFILRRDTIMVHTYAYVRTSLTADIRNAYHRELIKNTVTSVSRRPSGPRRRVSLHFYRLPMGHIFRAWLCKCVCTCTVCVLCVCTALCTSIVCPRTGIQSGSVTVHVAVPIAALENCRRRNSP